MAAYAKANRFRLSLDDDVLSGASDPSTGLGVVAEVGSLYLQTTPPQLWQKVDTADTDWTLVLTATTHGFRGFFGTGIDGNANIAGGTTTLTRDMFYQDLTIASTGILNPAGYRIYVAGTLTVDSGGVIGRNGGAAAGAVAGTGATANFLGGGTNGGTGQNTGGNAGTGQNNGIGGLPAGRLNGGAGGNGAGGLGGNGGVYNSTASGGAPYNFAQLLIGYQPSNATWKTFYTGGCGGGGGAGSGAAPGGGGGGGAGVMTICARNLLNNGTISANGGAGAAGTVTNAGGGGGGGGGVVGVVYETFSGTQPTANGGAGGASGGGTGVAGVAGGAGFVYLATP